MEISGRVGEWTFRVKGKGRVVLGSGERERVGDQCAIHVFLQHVLSSVLYSLCCLLSKTKLPLCTTFSSFLPSGRNTP